MAKVGICHPIKIKWEGDNVSQNMAYLKTKNQTINVEEMKDYRTKLKKVLIYELDMMSTLSMNAFNALEQSIKKGDEDQIWYHIHMLLFTYSSISELLQQMEIMAGHILETQEFQYLNDNKYGFSINKDELFDHFGRNLEDWIIDLDGSIIENHIFEKKSIPSLDVTQMLRHFDPETYELTFRDEIYNLKEDQKIVMNIKQKVEDIYSKNLWSI